MPPVPSILMYGRDICLLQTRALVLQHAGYRVAAVQNWLGAPAHEAIDLLILCHSLTQQQRRKALEDASDQWPTAKQLCLTPTNGPIDTDCLTFDSFGGPEKLIEVVGKLLIH